MENILAPSILSADFCHLEKDILTRDAGGMGILFIKSFADDVRYEYKDGENRLRVEKRIIAPEPDKSG